MSEAIACHDCDWLLKTKSLSKGQKACCPRCGATLMASNEGMVNNVMAYSLAGLLFYIPANSLPVMSFEMLGLVSTNTMLQGVLQLWQAGYWWMAFLVLLCSVVVPLLDLLLIFTAAVLLKLRLKPNILRRVLVWQHHLNEWAMLEVYMLGILVAYIKMSGMGNIVIGVGLYCFVGMLIAAILAESKFDHEQAFELLEDIES